MYTLSKRFKKTVISVMLLFSITLLFGQSADVMVNTSVIPPYHTDVLNYSNNTLVTLQSSINEDVSLFIDFKGENGVHLQTKQGYLPSDIVLDGNPQTITAFDLQSYFEFQNLISLGIPIAQIQQNGLPSGQYQICVRVRKFDGTFISGEEPLGCSNYFSINAVEPPQLITPFCGDEIKTGNNNVIFSWTMPPGADPSTIKYTLKMVELLPNQDPNQAFLASTIPAFFEKTVFTQTTILYGPTDPPLESGKSYAWQVMASDDEINTPFLNNGRSEVCWFTWKPSQVTIPLLLNLGNNNNGFVLNPKPTPISTLKGKLLYKFKGSGTSTYNSSGINTSNIFIDPNPVYPNLGNESPQVPQNTYPISTSGAEPLKGVSVSLVITYLFNGEDSDGTHNFNPVNDNQSNFLNDENQQFKDQVLATTITDGDGNFSFSNFINPHEDYGITQANIDATQNTEVQSLWLKGGIYKVLRLKVNNQYYLSPDINITINPWESKDIGTVVSLVKSYNLRVKAKWIKGAMDVQGGLEATLTGVNLNLTRTYVPDYVPNNEGNRNTSNSETNYTLGSDKTTDNGVLFKNLVQHNSSNSKDIYKITTAVSETSNVTYQATSKSFKQTKNVGSIFDNPFPYNSITYQSGIPQQGITWNHELTIKEYEDTIELIPNKPRISGVVQTTEAKLANKWVVLFNNKKDPNSNINIFEKTKTDNIGRYSFNNLPMEFEGYNTDTELNIIKGPIRNIFTAPKGFKGKLYYVGILKWGTQFMQDFNLEPDGFIRGFVVDEKGNPIKALVNVSGLAKKETTFGFLNTDTNTGNTDGYQIANGIWTEYFQFKAPSGQQEIVVAAVGDAYDNYSVYKSSITIPKKSSGNTKPIKIVLLKKQKRIRFKVVEYNTTKAIKNARVTLKDVATFEAPKLTDSKGFVEFIFENTATNFSFKIEAPKGKETTYTTQTFETLNVENTTDFSTFSENAYLKKAAKIKGIVTLDNKPLKDAKVFFQIGTELTEAYTDKNGNYILKGIAQDIETIELTATKENETPNVISQSKIVTIKAENTINFNLKYDKEVSIKTIFGFKVTIIEKEKQNDGTYIIKRGNLIEIPNNKNFTFREEKIVLPFSNLKIKKIGKNDDYGTPIFEPVENYVSLNNKTLNLKLNNAFNAILGDDSSQLKLTNNNGKGQIKGKIGIENKSFNTSNITLEQPVSMYLTQNGTSKMNIVALAVENPNVDRFGIVNPKGKELQFKLGNFEATAKQEKSYVTENKITLYTHLKTQAIEGLTPEKLEIEAGNLVLQPTKMIPINNNNPLKFKLEKWDFEAKKWVFNTKYLRIEMAKGLIKTGSIDIPANGITISSSELNIANFNLNELSFGGIAKLNVVGNTASFGLNQNVGSDNLSHWELRITGENNRPAAQLSLPGFETGKSINFDMVSILSNGEQKTNTSNNKSMKFYNIINVKPTNISSGDGYIDIMSMTDLGIPNIPESAGFIRYTKKAGKLVAKVAPLPFTLDAPGKVKLSVGNNPENSEIREGFFKAIGFLTDKEGINLQASIQKTNTNIHIEIEPGQNMVLGGSGNSFKNIEGGIKLNANNKWEKLIFSGELAGFKGVETGQRQTFIVHGDITADDEELNIDNIKTPFGDLELTYDIKNSRFLGHLNINQEIGGMEFVGSADMLVGSDGWYFSAGGKGTPPGIGEISVGLILGDSNYLAPDVTANLMQFAYDKNVPPTIQNGVSGLFVTGEKIIPLINIPDVDLDLGILSISLGAKAGIDARVWMNFDDSDGSEFGIGIMAFAYVYFEASSIACRKIGAEARAELGLKGKYQTAIGKFSIDGCGSISVSGHIEQCVPTLVAGCKLCTSFDFGKSVRLDLHLDSDEKMDVSFGLGNCSGN
jgi:hypothetical protein